MKRNTIFGAVLMIAERHYRMLLVSSGEQFIREIGALLQGGL